MSSRIPSILLRMFWGIFLLFTSVYCLLAFLPFTYSALIKAPPYDWIPWFVSYYSGLYWVAFAAAAIGFRPIRNMAKLLILVVQAAIGLYLLFHPFLASVQPNWPTYFWSLLSLCLVVSLAAIESGQYLVAHRNDKPQAWLLDYSTSVLAATFIALLWAVGAQWRLYGESHTGISLAMAEATGWSVLSHILVAILLLSVLNLIAIIAAKMPWPKLAQHMLGGLFIFGTIWFMLLRFFENALSFDGWPSQLYAAFLAAAVTLLGFSMVTPPLAARQTAAGHSPSRKAKIFPWVLAGGFSLFTVALPSLIQGGDWNGFIQHTVALAGWITLGVCAYRIRAPRAKYSIPAILAVAFVAGFAYKCLQATVTVWARPLGQTEFIIARTFENYAVRDASFDLVNHALGNVRDTPHGYFCRILREYTNIPNFPIQREANLANPLSPAAGDRLNIFIFVVDSLRPDYLGAYNRKVDFTPNLDAFARDSVVMRHAYTQYAGTSLSEPAIWAGMILLHDHDLSAFSKINSLEKLARVDGYREIISYDTVVRQFLVLSNNVVKLDADKPWNQVEACSTIEQTEAALDQNPGSPVFFYAQPMNVHQFAHNNLPRMTDANWHRRPGFINRIAYEVHGVDQCLGGFFSYLKQRNLYDHSIIVVTADHGDATGAFGRYSHSSFIYPEIMRVPILIHLPKNLRGKLVCDEQSLATLTDIAPSIYYLLGHRPIVRNPVFGHSLFAESQAELHGYDRDEIFFASDVRAAYGILAGHGRYFYATDDSAMSYLYDLAKDPDGTEDILTPALKLQYDQRIIEYLRDIARFYGYRPQLGFIPAMP
ncbi:MAG: sulfatase-like hydrolase/transferase [Verrucomicrobiota bacterium]|jgi:hypothetical protein